MTVKITAMNQKSKEVEYGDNMTVGDALKAADISVSKKDTILLNGKETKLAKRIEDGALLMVTPKIRQG